MRLARRGVWFREIAGNKEILLTSVVPASWHDPPAAGRIVFEKPILIDTRTKRVGIAVPVEGLQALVEQLSSLRFHVEHVYDY